jgi:hypothetical protein
VVGIEQAKQLLRVARRHEDQSTAATIGWREKFQEENLEEKSSYEQHHFVGSG